MVNNCELDRRITAYRFALYDLGLYLDSHPCDKKALQLREQYMCTLKQLVNEYEQHYGPYVLTQKDVGDDWTEWVCGPWPWEYGLGGGCHVAV